MFRSRVEAGLGVGPARRGADIGPRLLLCCVLLDSQESSPAPQFKSISSSVLSLLGGSEVKGSAWNAGDPGSIPGSGRPLEKEMATHSSTLA